MTVPAGRGNDPPGTGDKAYSHPSTRAALRTGGTTSTSPEKSDQITRRRTRGSRGGRPPTFDPDAYADRNVVERCFNRRKQFRDLAPATSNAPDGRHSVLNTL